MQIYRLARIHQNWLKAPTTKTMKCHWKSVLVKNKPVKQYVLVLLLCLLRKLCHSQWARSHKALAVRLHRHGLLLRNWMTTRKGCLLFYLTLPRINESEIIKINLESD